jgi:hypothetical protein
VEAQGGEKAHEGPRVALRDDEKVTMFARSILRQAIDSAPETLDQTSPRKPRELSTAQSGEHKILGSLDGGELKVLVKGKA